MLNPVYCNGCGKRLEIPEGFAKSKLRCAECGVFNEIPKEVREAMAEAAKSAPPKKEIARPKPPPPPPPAPEPLVTGETYGLAAPPTEPPPVDVKPIKTAKAKSTPRPKHDADCDETPREILIHGTNEDDGNPYQVTGDVAKRRCPECKKKVDIRLAVCGNCGFDFETGEKNERVYEEIDREWEAGWPLQKRVLLFIVFQVINFVTLVASLVAGHYIGVSFGIILLSIGLQAFLIGTYDRLNLKRTEKGRVTLMHTRRYGFIPGPTENARWKEHEGITLRRENEFEITDWICFVILMFYGCIPGILFYWFVIRPDKFTVALTKDHGSPETTIFRTTNEERAKDVLEVVSDVTTLPIQK